MALKYSSLNKRIFESCITLHSSSNSIEFSAQKTHKALVSHRLNADNFNEFVMFLKSYKICFELFKPKFAQTLLDVYQSQLLKLDNMQFLIENLTTKIEIFAFVSSSEVFKNAVRQLYVPFKTFISVFQKASEFQKFLYYGKSHIQYLIEQKMLTIEDVEFLMKNLKFSSEIDEFFRTPSLVEYSLKNKIEPENFKSRLDAMFGPKSFQTTIRKLYEDEAFLKRYAVPQSTTTRIFQLLEDFENG